MTLHYKKSCYVMTVKRIENDISKVNTIAYIRWLLYLKYVSRITVKEYNQYVHQKIVNNALWTAPCRLYSSTQSYGLIMYICKYVFNCVSVLTCEQFRKQYSFLSSLVYIR